MRRKSETKRIAILQTALTVFREVGFEAASMSQIAARVGGSKATLYNYFSSKEELLLEAMHASAREHGENIIALIGSNGDVKTQLSRFASSLMQVMATEETQQLLRVAISVSGKSTIGRRFFDLGTEVVWQRVALFMAHQAQAGYLRKDDPEVMAMHLRTLCECDLIAYLLGAGPALSRDQISAKAALLVDLFLRAHGEDKSLHAQ
jgi:AcrR family transcriptional regulator